jgi:hypothetical protein
LAESARQGHLVDVDFEPLDVIGDATHRRTVAMLRGQRCHAPPHALDQLVQLVNFGRGGQQISFEFGAFIEATAR